MTTGSVFGRDRSTTSTDRSEKPLIWKTHPFSQLLAGLFIIAAFLGLSGVLLMKLGGQAQRDHVLQLPTVSGIELQRGAASAGTEVKLSAIIAPNHAEVLPETGMVIAERHTWTPATDDVNSVRMKERDLEASFLPVLQLVALDGTPLRVEAGSRVLAGSASLDVDMQSSWKRWFRGLRNGDRVGLRCTIRSVEAKKPILTDVFLFAGTVDDVDGYYRGEVEESEELASWLFGHAGRVGGVWLILLGMRTIWRRRPGAR